MKNKKGFTLIELLVVVSIIGLLSTFAFVSLNSARVKARDTVRVSDVSQLAKALSLYKQEIGDYPVASECIDGSDAVTTALQAPGLEILRSFVKDPKDPSGDDCYEYVSADGSIYTLTYTLETSSDVGDAGEHTIQGN